MCDLTSRLVGAALLFLGLELRTFAPTPFDEQAADEQRLRADDADRQKDHGPVPLPERRFPEQELGTLWQACLGQSPPSQLSRVDNER
ncbi:MAG TPA: hypothetical protein VL308_06250, partial [Gemmatimonadaceae bacterium]|nr:hypothetical protein [Gemmatimonadaceae bacterium]